MNRKKHWSRMIQNRVPLELVFWITALICLAVAEPEVQGHEHHFTLCPLANMGFEWCPGCGIGRAITQLMHGNFAESFAQHWFGLPALLIILYRIVILIKLNSGNKDLKINYKEERYV